MRTMQCAVRATGVVMCIALLGGCASVSMQKAPLVRVPQESTALVTFVRPSIFYGDGLSVDIWDGERFIGALEAGTLVQYEAVPGEHLFLANSQKWAYTKANLLPGRRYFIKANIIPGAGFSLGAAQKTDSRIEEWLSKLTPMSALPADKLAVESKKQNEIREAVMEFKAGKVTSFSELRPEDGL